MTDTDRRNLTTLIRRAARRSTDQTWIARYAAERYYGLVTCGRYMTTVQTLVGEVLA